MDIYDNLEIEAENLIELPYRLQGEPNTVCADKLYEGTFHLREETANSFFINNNDVYSFVDNNDKAIDGVRIR